MTVPRERIDILNLVFECVHTPADDFALLMSTRRPTTSMPQVAMSCQTWRFLHHIGGRAPEESFLMLDEVFHLEDQLRQHCAAPGA